MILITSLLNKTFKYLKYLLNENNLNFLFLFLFAKIRYTHKGDWCTVRKTGEDEIECIFETPQRAVTPGQALVLYDGEYVLGGGTIL